jgi:FAD:protein FMN transferase
MRIQPHRFHPWKALWILALFLCACGCHTPGPANPSWGGQTMGSTYSVKLVGSRLSAPKLEDLKAAVDAALVEVNRQMSHYMTNSELSLFNRSTSTAPYEVSPSFATVTRFSLELSGKTDGMFDPTLGPLIDLWGFGPKPRRDTEPSESEIAAAEALCGFRHLSVVSNRFLQKDIPGLHLNLSAIAAGFGADEAARVIRAAGISNLFVDVTGEVVAFGLNAEGRPWRVGVDWPDPDSPPGGNLAAVLHLSSGTAVATSGNYRNFFRDENGRVYSHIFNPKLGRPVSHNLASVSVAATNCMVADGLSTTLFVLGPEEGRRWIETYPGAAALFIVRNEDGSYTPFASRGFEAMTGYVPPAP